MVFKRALGILTWTVLDIYVACVSAAHNVCPKGYWIAIVSTLAETSANHHLELQPGLDRLGKIEEQFMVRA
jgi:Rab GDP dissociation inhibitor